MFRFLKSLKDREMMFSRVLKNLLELVLRKEIMKIFMHLTFDFLSFFI